MFKKNISHSIFHTLLAVGLFLGIISISSISIGQETSKVLVTYNYQHNLLPKIDNKPLLTVYEDGKLQADFPSYMKRQGVHTAQLKAETLQSLKNILFSDVIQTIEPETILEEIQLSQLTQEAKEEQIAGTNNNSNKTVFAVHDSTTTTIEYPSPTQLQESNGTPTTNTTKIIEKDISTMAERHPNASVLQDANNLKKLLQNIFDSANWQVAGENS